MLYGIFINGRAKQCKAGYLPSLYWPILCCPRQNNSKILIDNGTDEGVKQEDTHQSDKELAASDS
jgi:hypothetical protein